MCVASQLAGRLMGFVGRLLGAAAGAVAVMPLIRWLLDVPWSDYLIAWLVLGTVLAGLWAGAALVRLLGEWMERLSRHVRGRSIASGVLLLLFALAMVAGVRQARSWLSLAPYRDDTRVVTAFRRDYRLRYAEAAARQEAETRRLRDEMSRIVGSGDVAREPPEGLDSDDPATRASAGRLNDYQNQPAGELVFPSGDPSWEVTRFEPTIPPTSVSWEVGRTRGDRVVGALTAVWAPTPMRNNAQPLVDFDQYGVDPRVIELRAWHMYGVSVTELHLFDGVTEATWRLVDAEVDIRQAGVPLPAEFVSSLTGISKPTR